MLYYIYKMKKGDLLKVNSKVEMKELRDWLRHQRNMINKDPYLDYLRGRLSFRIVKWNERQHAALVVVRDESKPETPFNSDSTHWVWVHTRSTFRKWEMWRAINDMACRIKFPN